MDTFPPKLQVGAESGAHVNERQKNTINTADTIRTVRPYDNDQIRLDQSPADGISIRIQVEDPSPWSSYRSLTEFNIKYMHKRLARFGSCIVRQAYIAVKDGQRYRIEATNDSKHEMIDIQINLDGLFAGHLPVPQGGTRTFKHTRLKKDEVHKISFTKIDYSESGANARLNKWFGEPGTISLTIWEADRLNLTEYELRMQKMKELRHGFTQGNLIATKKMRFGEVKRNANVGNEEHIIPTHISTLDVACLLQIQDKEYYVWRNERILYANYIYRSKETLQRHHKIPIGIKDEDLVQDLCPTTTYKKDVDVNVNVGPLEEKAKKSWRRKPEHGETGARIPISNRKHKISTWRAEGNQELQKNDV